MATSWNPEKAAGRVLLSPDVVPLAYDITLRPNLETFVCEGRQDVTLNVHSATCEIAMHAKQIAVTKVTFTPSGPAEGEGENKDDAAAAAAAGKELTPVEATEHFKDTTLTFRFEEELPVGTGTLHMEFRSEINNEMAGFYRSKYKDADGNEKIMASTQFEALDARRCFPCWDEPATKATFKLTLENIPSDLNALANMPEENVISHAGGVKTVVFRESPKMSTYLLAFAIGEFDFVSGVTKHGVDIRVYTPPGRAEQGHFALDAGIRSLDFYNDFFQLPYPLPKLDMIAITEFSMGAMENWGLVTYREAALLIDDAKASSQQKQRVAVVVAHELAHQWFGNLVTMQWWDDLWLNEGFACWMQHFCTDHMYPEWKMWEQFITESMAAAQRLDSLTSSHPIQVPIHRAEEVDQVFDAISYCKGACVVRMVEAVLGEDKFREGLQVYMDRHKYGNTETYHLWNAWSEVSGVDIGGLMNSWTEKMGYPWIRVVSASEPAADGSIELQLEQQWFLADGTDGGKDGASQLWRIPLIACTSGGRVAAASGDAGAVEIMSERQHTFRCTLSGANDFVKLNTGQCSMVRVAYTDDLLRRLADAMRRKALCPEDRAGLLTDAFSLARAGKVGMESVMLLLKACENEDDATVWNAMEQIIDGLHGVISQSGHDALCAHFDAFVAPVVKRGLELVGWDARESDGHLDKLLRATVIRLVGSICADDPEVIAEARRRCEAHIAAPDDADALPAEYRTTVFKIVLKSGTEDDYNRIKQLYFRTDSNVEQRYVMQGLGAINNEALKLATMEWAISGEVKLQDFFFVFHSVATGGNGGQQVAWDFLKENLVRVKEFGSGAHPILMARALSFCCQGFSTAEKATEVETFFKENPMPQQQRALDQTIEGIRISATLLERVLASNLVNEGFWANLA